MSAEVSAMPKSSPTRSYCTSRRWTEEEARAALAALAASGLSIREFASREGLDTQRLYTWRRKLGRSVAVATMPTPPPPAFVELGAGRPERIDVLLRSGRRLRCAEEISSDTLRRLVDALEEDGC
jgi:transposase